MAENIHQHHHHAPSNFGMVSAPHGPETGDDHVHMVNAPLKADEERIMRQMIYPDDTHTPEGVYWADLPLGKQLKFNAAVDNAEAKQELSLIGSMIKKDPLSPISWYFRNAVLPGAGLGLEGYVLFSIGNLTPLFSAAWPACWKTYEECNQTWVEAVQYLEVAGIIVGQILVGYLGDGIGRRWGLIQDAVIMFLGLLMLVASWGTTLNGWVICYCWALFFYGIGVGGEYPMTATAAMENATGSGNLSTRDDRLHRGRKVTMAFLMQGWGQFFNQVILILLLLIFHHGSGNPPYSKLSAQWTFRISFALPAIGTLWLVYYRTYKMPLASKALNAAKKKSSVTGYDIQSLKLTTTHFGGRLIATAGAWFCNDVFFYGNKLFQSQFIAVLSPNTKSIMTNWLWNLVNVGVSLCGYYLASLLIDNKFVGRKRMQQLGFLMDFVLFVIPAFHYHYYAKEKAHIAAFQAMYFLSSFFNQFGPNSTTFLVAAEVFPTPVRASAHGFSAAVGKLGALLAAILYNYIDTQTKFYVVPWFGLAGMLVTWLFLPDTTGLDLKEQERRFTYIRAGREHEYHGIAVHPHHLSLWERIRGAGKHYNPELDYQTKVDDLRAEWTEKQAEKMAAEESLDHHADDEYPLDVHEYFAKTTNVPGMTEKKHPGSSAASEETDNEKPLPQA
ncbi:putative inorganic phosphate transporter C8E4.01c [Amylocarpus encephaloides]|uniref:Inorganic phosphate transporter C8E4.01c n=1 Tax=Amylocarpus encephaloides TaxID=45428 RepID=A0A9P8C7V4_9HELO|nr:putative inorganic phosphate transporter C8E4.01c [Amylocarpus encephaloides]